MTVKGLLISAAFAAVALFLCQDAAAQYISGTRWDDGMYAFKHSAMSKNNYEYENFFQYGPAVPVVVMKAFGLPSRSKWGPLFVSAAFSVGLEVGLANAVKYMVKRQRPDLSAKNSFPSGHTATAFMTATILQKEYGWRYPWVGFGGYALATAVGFSRNLNDRHWGTDVIGGALFGIAATELGYYLSSLIFKDKSYTSEFLDSKEHSEFPARDAYELGIYCTTAAWYAAVGDSPAAQKTVSSVPTAYTVFGICGYVPFAGHLGALARAALGGTSATETALSPSTEVSRSFSDSYEIEAGLSCSWDFFSLMYARPHAYAGVGMGKQMAGNDGFSARFQCDVGAEIGLQITENYSFKFIAEYKWRRSCFNAVMLGGGASFCF